MNGYYNGNKIEEVLDEGFQKEQHIIFFMRPKLRTVFNASGQVLPWLRGWSG